MVQGPLKCNTWKLFYIVSEKVCLAITRKVNIFIPFPSVLSHSIPLFLPFFSFGGLGHQNQAYLESSIWSSLLIILFLVESQGVCAVSGWSWCQWTWWVLQQPQGLSGQCPFCSTHIKAQCWVMWSQHVLKVHRGLHAVASPVFWHVLRMAF